MLLDYDPNPAPRRAAPEGVQVAGLLDLIKLMEHLGKPLSRTSQEDWAKSARDYPDLEYDQSRTFIAPGGKLMVDTGPTYTGRRMPKRQTLQAVQDSGSDLSAYLDGTQMGDVFRDKFKDIRVGMPEQLPGAAAGFKPPTYDTAGGLLEPGVLAVRRDAAKGDIGGLFEHELDHAYQWALGMPSGTKPDNMDDPVMEYLTSIGAMDPAKLMRIDDAAKAQGTSKLNMRYAAASGEAGARASELRQIWRDQGATPWRPEAREFLWTHDGPTLTEDMLFDPPQGFEDGFNAFWRKKWQKGAP